MFKVGRFRKPLTMGLSLLLAFTMVHPVSAENPASQKIDMKSGLAEISTAKVNAKLNQQFKDNEYVTYLVKMKEQVDTTRVSKQAIEKAAVEKMTPAAAKLSVRTSVVSSLRETASRTQYALEQYLEQEIDRGKVKEYKSFFIVNALAVTSTKEVMENLALQPEVEKILPNEERFLQETVIDKSVQAPDHKQNSAKDDPKASKDAEAAAQAPAAGRPANGSGAQTAVEPKEPAAESALNNSNVEWNIDYINAPAVWERGIDGTGIVVANLDTGVDHNHPALARKWRGRDASGNIVNPELSWYDPHSRASLPADTDGHGTHTMGTMVGSEANGDNIIGVAPGATWIAVRIFNPSTTDAIILDGAQWLLAPVDAQGNLHPELAPDVVNNSWGGGPGLDEWFRPMVQAWRDAQIFPEFSAGNTTLTNPGGPGSVANPANYPESFATGATDINGNLASFSLRGPSPYGEIKPEVSAPGVNIRSAVPGGGYEGGWNGTSMAGPHTTALAALLLQANHSLTVDQLEQIMTETATPRTDSQYPTSPNNGYGHGIINALDAVGSVLEGIGTVSGRVVTAGDDLEEPVLEHTPVNSAFTGIDVPLTAYVSDNVGVVSVEAFAKTTGTDNYLYLPMQRIAGDSKAGTYTTVIPAFLVEPQGLEYYIRVNDYGNNGYESKVYKVAVSNGVKPGYIQDFEESDLGFTTGGTGNTWAWGAPTSGPGSAYSGDKLFATNLAGSYQANANAFLLAPPIDLTDSPEGAILSFRHWYDFENNYDFGKVYIASEDSDFVFEEAFSFTGSDRNWRLQYLDLTSYGGQRVFVQFVQTSDGSVQRDGWYIDDFSVQPLDDVAPGAPANLTAETDIVGNVILSWTAPEDEDLSSFTVYRSTTSGADYEAIGSASATSYTDTTTASGSTYYYAVAAVDFSGNESAKSNEVSVSVNVPEDIFIDTFDGDSDNGWTHSGTNDEWERGVPTSGPGQAASPPNVWATDLDSNYENGSNYSLVSPVIDLTEVSQAALTFNHWYEIEGGYDFGYVEASKDGGNTWTELGRFSHNTNGRQWAPVFYNLEPLIGHEAQFRFRLTSDNSVVRPGWYIDDFRILAVEPETATKNDVLELSRDKEKPVYDNSWYKVTSTDKYEFNQAQSSAPQPAVKTGEIVPQSLPAYATVTVIETGRSVKTDPATGRYSFTHVAGDYTLKAEAYGYYPQTQSITIADGRDVRANFNLEAIPQGRIQGVVIDERTGEPVADAAVLLVEDPAVSPARTDESGSFTLEALEGSYTLSVKAADYYSTTVEVTVPGNGVAEVAIELKPFIGFPGEIAYDDGTAENARAFNAANNAWAVRMTPESDVAQVTGASFRFWNTEWPTPGGTAFQYAVYDASGAGGAPGRLLAGPFDGTALRNDQWTVVEFPEPVTAEGDFYIVYIQTAANPNAPGLATDENGPNAGRSWQRVSGAWSASPAEEGNYMIRAIVRYPVNAPVITSPEANAYTNQSVIAVTGTSPATGAEIQIYNDDEPAGSTTVDENGQFTLDVELYPGANTLTAEIVVNGRATDRSLPVVVTLDQTPPELSILSPENGSQINAEVVRIIGSALDDFLDTLFINGQPVQLDESGAFNHRLLVDEGENIITVTATDLARNETTVTRSVYVNTSLPEILNVSPAEDVHIAGGETLTVSFDSVPGLAASFSIQLPFELSSQSRGEIPLQEVAPGHYEGTYTTPASLVLEGGVIVIRVQDGYGNVAETQAPGRLYVAAGNSGEEPEPEPEPPIPPANLEPVALINAPSTARRNQNINFDARSSYDQDGRIVSYHWNFGDGSTAAKAQVKHKYKSAGTYTVRLTVTDDKGAQSSAVHTVIVRN
ncbi:S8 family serine peptidase [Paenibacillus campinasensis]|uniref:Serine protease n=1 Tax=Paenibacillus campinasensis TaxID=66347 RepID=A0A268EU10_9BACL|nr:S8 family serine peptidase [Paenibacillus campinasensis]PAD76617.1 serine protease [Paenibacillus campinasensis]